MFEFLGRGRAKSDKPGGDDPGPSTMPMLGVPTSATLREMVRFALHNVLKLNGIPSDWLSGETVPVHIPGQGDALVVQLEIMQWHDTLVLHGPALQRELMEELRRFDPDADASRYLFVWKFSPESNCPHTRLPQPDFWVKIAAHASAPTAKEAAKDAAPVAPATTAASAPTPSAAAVPAKAPKAGKASASSKAAAAKADEHHDHDDDDHGFAPTEIRDTQ